MHPREWEAVSDRIKERLEFIDLQFATLRQMLYHANRGRNSPDRRLDEFRLLTEQPSEEEMAKQIDAQFRALAGLL